MLVQRAKSGDIDVRWHATWGMSGDTASRPDPPTFDRSGDLRRRSENKTLDQPEKSGDLDIKRQASWGMSVKTRAED